MSTLSQATNTSLKNRALSILKGLGEKVTSSEEGTIYLERGSDTQRVNGDSPDVQIRRYHDRELRRLFIIERTMRRAGHKPVRGNVLNSFPTINGLTAVDVHYSGHLHYESRNGENVERLTIRFAY